jgi:hypothetical protein
MADHSIPELRPIDLDHAEIDPEILQRVPIRLVRRFRILPVFSTGDAITIAMGDPRDADLLDHIQRELSSKVEGVWATQESIDKKIAEYYPGL